MGLLIGMDEAGLGPNYGPLVVTITVWELRRSPRRFDMWSAMADVAEQTASKDPLKLQIADSKQVYAPGKGLAALEKSVLSALRLLNQQPKTLSELERCLNSELGTRNAECGTGNNADSSAFGVLPVAFSVPPWLVGRELSVPREIDSSLIGDIATKWAECCRKAGVKLKAIRSEVVQPERFNSLVRDSDNKARALSQLSLKLLRSVWDPDEDQTTLVICDKHGGRNRYDELLTEILDGQMVMCAGESLERSVYRIGASELRFEMKAEANFPVAMASLVCKYVRELSMELFNQFWAEHVPGIKSTAGYPMDSARFRADIAEAQRRLGISDDILWRHR